MAGATQPAQAMTNLPLFPLQTVLMPGSVLALKVFEARYLDLVAACLRDDSPFGVVCLRQGSEVRRDGEDVAFEPVGVLAHVKQVDSDTQGILKVRCMGGQRFALGPTTQQADGLWLTQTATLVDADPVLPPGPQFEPTAQALSDAIAALAVQHAEPFAHPYRMNDAGWVANRWCELLPIPLPARQMLMALDDPLLRLQLVDEYLRDKGVVT